MTNNSTGKIRYSSLMQIVIAIFFSLTLLPFLSGCRAPGEETRGSLTLLYTSEVGGKLDPCG